MKRWALTYGLGAVALAMTWGSPGLAQEQAPDTGIGLTIYSAADPLQFDPQRYIAQQRGGITPQAIWQVPGFGVIRDVRLLDLQEGRNTVGFTDVAQFIDPTTVSLVDLTAPGDRGVQVLEQSFQFDLVNPQKLMEKYLDQGISVNLNLGGGQREQVSGTLLSATGGQLVLQTDAGLRLVPAGGDVQLGELPEGLITRPTLQWLLQAPAAGQRRVRTTYQTGGITWRADYNLILNERDTAADLGAWVSIMNLSGARYPNAQLKLIAGDVQQLQPPQPMLQRRMQAEMAVAADAVGFEEKAFFEYHMYTLPRRTTIEQNSTQQLALFPTVRDVPVRKKLVYYGLPDQSRLWRFGRPAVDRNLGTDANKKVDVYIEFENREQANLGIPLPKGKVRVFKADDDGSLEFVGEDLIDHMPRNQTVRVKIGQAFDVTGDRVQTDFRVDNRANWMEETIRITVSNAKDEPQDVIIRESLYRWVNWEVLRHSDPFEKIDSRTIHFEVTVPAEGDKVVEYTVRYTW